MMRYDTNGRLPLRAALLGASTLAFSLAAPVLAQTAQPTTAAAEEAADDEILVSSTPIRDSIAKALGIKREAVNIVDAIAADTIGRFPDQTAAAALARLPGVAVQRDQGQERFVQVRGAPARWTNVAFDGINVVGAEGRIFRFDAVPATTISTLELNKTLTPEMPGEALSGRVNIRTFSALDNPGLHLSGDAGAGFVDLGNGPVRSFGGRVSWSNDRFGIVLGGSTFSFVQETDNYEPRFDAVGLQNIRFAKYIVKRQSNGAIGKLEWKINEQNLVRATALYKEFLDDEQRNQYTFNFAGAASGTRNNTNGDLVAVPVTGLFQDSPYATKEWLYVLHGEHSFSQWTVSWDGGYSKSVFSQNLGLPQQTSSNALQRPSVIFSPGEANTPVLRLFDTVLNANGMPVRGTARARLDQRAFSNENFIIFRNRFDQNERFGKLDITRSWSSFGAEALFKAGFQYNDRDFRDPGNFAILRPDGTAGTINLRQTAAQFNLPWTPLDLITDRSALGRIDVGFDVNFLDNSALRRQYDAIIAESFARNAAGGNFPVPRSNPALATSIDERIFAAYFSNQWKWDRHILMAGLRVERTNSRSAGQAAVGAVLTPVAFDNNYTQFFPSVHYGFDATDTLKLRAAFITGTARPEYVDMRANVAINDANMAISGGNPFLLPERAWGIDASAEWYFAPGSLLSLSYYYRNVSRVLFDSTIAQIGDGRFNSDGIDRSDYTFATTVNGSDGYLQGAELAFTMPFTFLPGALDGFGFQGSVALIDGNFDDGTGRNVAFPGTSRRVTNAALYYEKYGASLRLSWQDRTDYLDSVAPGNAAGDLYWEGQQRLDFSARYDINPRITVYADITNLTDERGLRYVGDRTRPFELEYFGRRFLFGVRARY